MQKTVTQVGAPDPGFRIRKNDRTMVLGSCFATQMGRKMAEAGFDGCLNPFGTIFNPASIRSSIERMESARPFTPGECVEMGAGAGKICSFSHHTSFARQKAGDFLEVANSALAVASQYWKESSFVILTLGTAFVWKHLPTGKIVSNCLKRPGYEFSHEMLGVEQIAAMLQKTVEENPGKRFIFTVSPIRHLGDGAHANTLSKSTLQLAINSLKALNTTYFPSYEIMLDELRDYHWYGADLVHPTEDAIDIIWRKFRDGILSDAA